MRLRPLLRTPGPAVAVVVVLALALAACSGGSSSSDGTTATTAPATTTTTTHASTTVAPTTTHGSTTTTAAGPPRCQTSHLQGSLGQPDAGAGQLYVPVVLRNTSSATCHLTGFPGVSLLDAGGSEIGAPATRDPAATPQQVTLAAGASASAVLHTVNGGISGAPCRAPSTQVRVYPPDETQALTFAGVVEVCGDVFTVGPVVAGESGR